jgi:hypothetical protein
MGTLVERKASNFRDVAFSEHRKKKKMKKKGKKKKKERDACINVFFSKIASQDKIQNQNKVKKQTNKLLLLE